MSESQIVPAVVEGFGSGLCAFHRAHVVRHRKAGGEKEIFVFADTRAPGLGGLAISEAMTHGLPVVATLADGCEADLIEEGRNGHILEPGDLPRLEACLEALLSDETRLREMGAHSRRIIEERCNIDTYMENLVAALDYTAGAGEPGGEPGGKAGG